MMRHLVDVERRFSMQPGKLPDKELRMNLGVGWIVTAIDDKTGHHIALLVNNVYGDNTYSGTVVNQLTAEMLRFDSRHVLEIISTKTPPKEKKNGSTPPKKNRDHAIQAPQVQAIEELREAGNGDVPGRPVSRPAHPLWPEAGSP